MDRLDTYKLRGVTLAIDIEGNRITILAAASDCEFEEGVQR